VVAAARLKTHAGRRGLRASRVRDLGRLRLRDLRRSVHAADPDVHDAAAEEQDEHGTKPSGKNVRIVVKVRGERPNGFFPTDFATVRLEKFESGRWVTVRRSQGDTDDGRYAQTYLRPSKRLKVRAVTVKGDHYSGSTSKPVTVDPS
jgi:hypothetical protein